MPALSLQLRAGLCCALFGVLEGCSGGGSDDDPATTVSFESASSQISEVNSTTNVRVVLRTVLPSLEQAVSVVVSDPGLGTAMAGADFTALAATVVDFPEGAVDGDVVVIAITSIDDSAAEGTSETIRLQLAAPTGGAGLGSVTAHTLRILDDDQARLSFDTSSLASSGENGTLEFEVRLELDPGVTLVAPLSVDVVDPRAGSATAGLDYAFAPLTILIPAASADGATFPVQVTLLDDTELEGAETIELELESQSQAFEIGTPSLCTLIIDDDEAGVGTQLLTTLDPRGGAATINAGATLQFGALPIGSGASSDLVLRFTSIGAGDVSLEVPWIEGTHERDFEVEFAEVTSSSVHSGFAAHAIPSPFAVDEGAGGPGLALALDSEILEVLSAFDDALWLDVPTVFGALPLELARVRSPWASDALLFVDGSPRPFDSSRVSFWRGRIVGDDRSDVFLALESDSAQGWIRRGDGATQHVLTERTQSVTRIRGLGDDELGELGAREPTWDCPDPPTLAGATAPRSTRVGSAGAAATTWPVARLALESDYQLYQRFHSAEALSSYVSALIAATSASYLTSVGTELQIAYLGIHTGPSDGWNTPDGPGTTSAMLDEFQHAWGPAWGGSKPVEAHLAHFLSGAALGGGIAYVGVLCDPNWGFAVSANLNAAINWPMWTGAAGPLTWDFVVFAHELGHNFGSQHTHTYCPPLDQCYSNCLGSNLCAPGTLMSYCHICGGMANVELRLHPFTANVMRAQVVTSCLGEIRLQPTASVDWILRFRPTTATGTLRAELSFQHDALNQPALFELHMVGASTQ